jgi:hypothetical protein
MYPHTTIYMSLCNTTIFVCILLYMRPHTTICFLILLYVSSYYYTCVLILLHMCSHTAICMCPHTTMYVSSYCYTCASSPCLATSSISLLWTSFNTQFTCFTSTKVKILTQPPHSAWDRYQSVCYGRV